jgi:hypothetical protein
MGYRAPKTKIICKSYDPRKLMYQLTPSRPTLILTLHLLGLDFWMSGFFLLLLDAKNAWMPHCNVLGRMRVAATYLLKD